MTMEDEKSNIRFGPVMIAGGGLLALVGFGLWLSWGMYLYARDQTSRPGKNPATFTDVGKLPPEPRLQADPHSDLLRLRASEDSVLSGYAWVNRDSGFVRIPVERAMAILAAKGLPAGGAREGVQP